MKPCTFHTVDLDLFLNLYLWMQVAMVGYGNMVEQFYGILVIYFWAYVIVISKLAGAELCQPPLELEI